MLKNKVKRLSSILLSVSMIAEGIGFGMAESVTKPEIKSPAQVYIDNPDYKVTYHESTCTEAGYWLCENQKDFTSVVIDDGEPLGHQWGYGDDGTGVCSRCGEIKPASEDSTARLDLLTEPAAISKENKVVVPVTFTRNGESFTCYGYINYQGHSTLNLSKKNYTVRFYDDETLEQKHPIEIFSDRMEHKYILKAYMNDTTMSRDITCARLWSEVVQTREHIPEQLKQSPNYGAVDGIPVTLWIEGNFSGLYRMNLHKDNDLYYMNDDEYDAIMICDTSTMPESLFEEPAAFVEDVTDWEVEYEGADQEWAMDHFNELIRFITDTDDATFKNELSSELDTEAAIDYLIFIWAMGLKNNAAKDLVMLTYGGVWIPSVYDMEEAFGLVCGADEFLPAVGENYNSATGSLLWDRLLKNFEPEIRERYAALRSGPLSEENITAQLEACMDEIPQNWLEKDLELYPGRTVSTLKEIKEYITVRLNNLDLILLN